MRHFVFAAIVACGVGRCVCEAKAGGTVEMLIGGTRDVDANAVMDQPLIVEFGDAYGDTHAALSKVLAWTSLVERVAKRIGVDQALLMAVIDVESGGNALAVSPKGARGLMQLMPQTGLLQGADNLFDPYQNVMAGARLLDALLATFGDVSLALAAYNAGEGAVRKYGDTIPPYAETRKYVQRVMERVAAYRR
ncbi:lytic transglycosylase domain-containing protein [Paraburkholderia sp. Tr-20389]|uniref:lytic transglycosylase domain-containing protein n=1 Tax=Paraburkholderia sp. Tr-20389 TaxID=2703903 RepID=UPI001F12077A|nr:lytic transglycosylase domain-containing protein [Paraburkholderia sp. Tr-20389]